MSNALEKLKRSTKKGIKIIDKNGNETVETISYKVKFIDSTGFMTRSFEFLLNTSQRESIKLTVKNGAVVLNIEMSRKI